MDQGGTLEPFPGHREEKEKEEDLLLLSGGQQEALNQTGHDETSSAAANETESSLGANHQSLSFRKRRLSLPRHQLQAASAVAAAAAALVVAEKDADENGKENTKTKDMEEDEPGVESLLSCATSALSDLPNGDINTPQRLMPDEQQHTNQQALAEADEKAHTFRKRRLSLTFNQMPSLSSLLEDESNDKGEKGSKTTTRTATTTTTASPMTRTSAKRQRRLSAESSVASSATSEVATTPSTTNSQGSSKKPRILHSAEMISGPFAPPSPIHHNHVLHKQNPLPPSHSSALDEDESTQAPLSPALQSPQQEMLLLESNSLEFSPKQQRTSRTHRRRSAWKQRHHHSDEDMLPFPKNIVGTYSCHGIEPIYDENDFLQQPLPEEHLQVKEEEQPSTAQAKLSRDNQSFWGETHDDDPLNGVHATNTSRIQPGLQQQQQQQPQHDPPSAISAKINQDRGGITYPYANSDRTALFAVYDGHGQGGELVSQFALHEIQRRLEKHALFQTNLEMAMRETFLTVDEGLKHEPIIEPFFAGTTACIALLQDKHLTMANAGDSRAVLGRKRPDNGDWRGVDLTIDQNPDSPAEMERILKLGGHVSLPPGPGLSARVWLDPEMTQIGLAMARSIGDHAVSDVGVIADPVVSTYTLTDDDEFIILASDGVWEFLDSQDAVQIVGDHLEELGATKACQALIEAAASRWHEEEGEYRDDITAIVVHVQKLWDSTTITTTTSTTAQSSTCREGSSQHKKKKKE